MRLIDADALNRMMYRKAFETDDGRQKWDSGLWIRYKIFEEAIDETPTADAIPVWWIKEWYERVMKFACDGSELAVDMMLDDWERRKYER